MPSPAQAEGVARAPKGARAPCETPGCSERCAYAYSCHDLRMGRWRLFAWPVAGLVILLVIGIAF